MNFHLRVWRQKNAKSSGKFEKYEATTRLNEIRVQVGKTGTITPVAELEPVELAGTIVSRASLHNADEIARKDVRQGDVVIVEKAGKIIPHIVRVEKHKREGRPRKFAFPDTCPEQIYDSFIGA